MKSTRDEAHGRVQLHIDLTCVSRLLTYNDIISYDRAYNIRVYRYFKLHVMSFYIVYIYTA